jgi:endoglucanase
MDDDQFTFFQRLVETTGPSGYEEATQKVWRERVAEAASVQGDPLGNAIASLNPSGSPRVMLEAHIDEIGFQIKHIDDEGFLYFHTLGGFDAATLAGNRVRILGRNGPVLGVIGRPPTHLLSREERSKAPKAKDMWIDIAARDRQHAEEHVKVGDPGGRCHGVERMLGNFVSGNSFDDRMGCYVIAEVTRALAAEKLDAAVFAASCVQEEVGSRGAGPAAFVIDAPIGIAVDVTYTTDHPNASKSDHGDLRCGAGPVLTRGPNTNPRVFERLQAAAEAADVPYQIDADPRGTGTDQNVMYVVRGGMATGLVSIPTRYLHGSSEILSLDDIDAAVMLLKTFVQQLEASIDLTP